MEMFGIVKDIIIQLYKVLKLFIDCNADLPNQKAHHMKYKAKRSGIVPVQQTLDIITSRSKQMIVKCNGSHMESLNMNLRPTMANNWEINVWATPRQSFLTSNAIGLKQLTLEHKLRRLQNVRRRLVFDDL